MDRIFRQYLDLFGHQRIKAVWVNNRYLSKESHETHNTFCRGRFRGTDRLRELYIQLPPGLKGSSFQEDAKQRNDSDVWHVTAAMLPMWQTIMIHANSDVDDSCRTALLFKTKAENRCAVRHVRPSPIGFGYYVQKKNSRGRRLLCAIINIAISCTEGSSSAGCPP
jgi:hypothetical protein